MTHHFQSIFHRDENLKPRAKFLSRVFGIFSEEIVSLWASDARAPYENLGRPTIKSLNDSRGYTLDFTLKERASGRIYIAEMKCEIEYQKFKYFVLEDAEQLAHHKKPAFDAFLKSTTPSADQVVYVNGKRVDVQGAILIWGSVSADGKKAVMASKGFHDILSVANICHDLISWNHDGYRALIVERREWCNDLFGSLLESQFTAPQPHPPSTVGYNRPASGDFRVSPQHSSQQLSPDKTYDMTYHSPQL